MEVQMRYFRFVSVIVLMLGLGVHTGYTDSGQAYKAQEPLSEKIRLDVYKSPTCTCCAKWVEHMEAEGFEVAVHHPSDLRKIKAKHGIAARLQACHTAVSEEGYVFEGHIPAKFIREFFKAPPEYSAGLVVPGMPVGSPGMESENRFSPYRVLLLKTSGGTTVYSEIKDARGQYR